MAVEPKTMSSLFIAGDWGTSRLRLYLCEYCASSTTKIIQTIFGEGISNIQGDFERIFFELIDDWLKQYGNMPVILSGMVGSNIGWREVPYINCPVNMQQLAVGHVSFTVRGLEIHITAGLSTINYLGKADVMRGEECQIFGWQHVSKQNKTTHLIALPGTHNKWVLVRDDRIETFMTAVTGELFALLKDHSVLISASPADHFNEDVFFQAFDAINNTGGANLIHLLFTTRSQQVTGKLAAEDSVSYLTGLLVGADVIGALDMFRRKVTDISNVVLIGDPKLTKQYKLALNHLDVNVEVPDIEKITIAGYQEVYEKIYIDQI